MSVIFMNESFTLYLCIVSHAHIRTVVVRRSAFTMSSSFFLCAVCGMRFRKVCLILLSRALVSLLLVLSKQKKCNQKRCRLCAKAHRKDYNKMVLFFAYLHFSVLEECAGNSIEVSGRGATGVMAMEKAGRVSLCRKECNSRTCL